MNILLTGFKTKEEVKAWLDAYSGSVEQEMANCAEGDEEGKYEFPWELDYHKQKINDEFKDVIEVPMIHPNTYLQEEDE